MNNEAGCKGAPINIVTDTPVGEASHIMEAKEAVSSWVTSLTGSHWSASHPMLYGTGGKHKACGLNPTLHLVLSGPAPCFYPAAAPSSHLTVKE